MEPPLPPCPVPFIVEHLVEIGPVVSSGMGSAPIGWSDILAWQACTGVALSPWASRQIRSLSIAYLTMCREAEKPDCPAPWQSTENIETNRDQVSRRLSLALNAIARRGNRTGRKR